MQTKNNIAKKHMAKRKNKISTFKPLPATKKWNRYYIPTDLWQKLKKTYSEGSRIKSASFNLHHINIYYLQKQKRLKITGKFIAPRTPKELRAIFSLQLLKNNMLYLQQDFTLQQDNTFEIILDISIWFDIYLLRISLFPESQDKFLRYFLHIEHQYDWHKSFKVGTTKQVKQCYISQQKEWQNILSQIYAQYQDFAAYTKQTRGQIKSSWRSFSSSWRKNFTRLENRIKHYQNLPLLPQVQKDIYNLKELLHKLYQKLENWQLSFSLKDIDVEIEKLKFENSYEHLKLVLPELSQKIKWIAEQKVLSAIIR